MKAVMPSAPPDVLAFRKRTGADRWDEMWDGVLHMAPAPSPEHQRFEGALLTYLRNRWAGVDGNSVFHNVNVAPVGGWPHEYRVPDLILLIPSSRAIQRDLYFEGSPEVVVEIRSPEDETLDKLSFYAALGVSEVWVLDRDTKVPVIYVLRDGHYEAKAPGASGWLHSDATGLELRSTFSAKLSIRLRDDESSRESIPED